MSDTLNDQPDIKEDKDEFTGVFGWFYDKKSEWRWARQILLYAIIYCCGLIILPFLFIVHAIHSYFYNPKIIARRNKNILLLEQKEIEK